MPRSGLSKPLKPAKTPVTPVAPTPTTHHSVEVKQPGFFSNMMQGFALGSGQSLAFNLFRSDPVVKHEYVSTETKEYKQCMVDYMDEEFCKQYKK
jgi:hypothetical protein